MSEFTLQELRNVVKAAVNADDLGEIGEETLDTEFIELGYDSLALLEVLSVIQREYGLRLPDEATESMQTPGEALAYINERFKAAEGSR
ncbi:acyl carrier protein [Nocardiopsis sp. CNT-189]|uniref:acyl carrier protein n=1 Tax=Nocardiopsis TaxID=2013 RepID=UPI00034BFFDC|nr:acyl carrier protein [Nocardiopsis potens]